MDVTSHIGVATDSLWATLRTIGVMQQYQKHGIENHPAILAEYVRFLFAHSALGTIAKFESKFENIEAGIKEIGNAAKAAQSTAGTAQNKAMGAIKIAQKSSSDYQCRGGSPQVNYC